MYKHILQLLALVITSQCFSQTSIKATIINQNKKPVDFASIYLPDSKKSTISNEDGEFYMIINPDIDKTVIINHLSYQPLEIKITNSFPETIIMEEGAFQLKEIAIGNQLTGYDVALKVVENLEKNHDADPAYYEYFTRIVPYYNNKETVNLVQEYYGKLQHTSNHNTKAIIKKSRAITYNKTGEELYEKETTISFWATRDNNLLLYKPDFLKKGKLKKYEIILEGSANINGIDCYQLTYNSPKYGSAKIATMYVDKKTFGIVKVTDTVHERTFAHINDKWVLTMATRRSIGSTSTTLYNYLTNEKDYANEDFDSTTFNEKIKKYNKDKNDTFWENYQHIPLPEN